MTMVNPPSLSLSRYRLLYILPFVPYKIPFFLSPYRERDYGFRCVPPMNKSERELVYCLKVFDSVV